MGIDHARNCIHARGINSHLALLAINRWSYAVVLWEIFTLGELWWVVLSVII